MKYPIKICKATNIDDFMKGLLVPGQPCHLGDYPNIDSEGLTYIASKSDDDDVALVTETHYLIYRKRETVFPDTVASFKAGKMYLCVREVDNYKAQFTVGWAYLAVASGQILANNLDIQYFSEKAHTSCFVPLPIGALP